MIKNYKKLKVQTQTKLIYIKDTKSMENNIKKCHIFKQK